MKHWPKGNGKLNLSCKICCRTDAGDEDTDRWWKCCHEHTPPNTRYILCESCYQASHPEREPVVKWTEKRTYPKEH